MAARPTSRSWPRALLREARSLPTLALLGLIAVVGVPLVILLTPENHVEVFGQDVGVGARVPPLTLSGPAQIAQLGNAEFDLTTVQVWGPIRPRLSIGPLKRPADNGPVLGPHTVDGAGDAVRDLGEGFVTWYLWGAAGMVLVALLGSGLMATARLLLALRRTRTGRYRPVHWDDLAGPIGRMTVVAVTASVLLWAGAGVAALHGTLTGLGRVTSLTDLVGAATVTPSPVGPAVTGVAGAVIGDSRAARIGGPPLRQDDGTVTSEDRACGRSTDSTAAELARLRDEDVLNLACSGAGVATGLRGPQLREGVTVDPQVGRLKQVRNLQWVVVAVGPNDLAWSDFLLYCYGLATCDDRLSDGEFESRLAGFARDVGALFTDLDTLPGRPRVVVTLSYDPFPARFDPTCADMRGPAGTPGLDQAKLDLLAERNRRLNDVLADGAARFGFGTAAPALAPLCDPDRDRMPPDIMGLATADPFHPTAVGSLRIAAAAATALAGPRPTGTP
ncbi:GDSL-type esterase/lipase family protein [Pseudonocardia alni]|uniref:GDSL-like lipase/acylhydrolase family protein n=1 Tax=Pseudonocardia alni TaxID=33907 RepID=A0AA44ZMI9_PSEA5|nr:GDSL-type esterase/lipase family protein [Pseudonocardia alni]PKB28928.1 GDSL-like lipase/acylhydrolase family protein [Pseudonocardia alni]